MSPGRVAARHLPLWTFAAVALVATGCFGAVATQSEIPPASVAPPAVDSQTPEASASPAAVERTLTAHNIAFQPSELTAPAGTDILIGFDNMDQGVPHGLALYRDAAHTIVVGTAPIVQGPDHQVFRVLALAPGRYQFSCVVHPPMVADLIVTP